MTSPAPSLLRPEGGAAEPELRTETERVDAAVPDWERDSRPDTERREEDERDERDERAERAEAEDRP
ncbi:hypothetical protein [Streptomyces sp. NPDC003034]